MIIIAARGTGGSRGGGREVERVRALRQRSGIRDILGQGVGNHYDRQPIFFLSRAFRCRPFDFASTAFLFFPPLAFLGVPRLGLGENIFTASALQERRAFREIFQYEEESLFEEIFENFRK